MRESECKSCKAGIIWAMTPAGKMTPLDAKPIRVVTMLLEQDPPKIEEAASGYTSHWATCPTADQHRRAKR